MSVTLHQTDPRWAGMRYAGYSVRTAGCGAIAVSMIVVNNPKYAKVTPKEVIKFLEPKYTVKGNGTMWTGITAVGKHYGFNVTQFSTVMRMFGNFDQNGDTWGIILMNNSTRNGIKWTSSGHYLAFTAYKKDSKGRHWLYLRDPNPAKGRNHTGWYCYEKHFKGNVKAIWAYRLPKAELKPEKPKPEKRGYTGEFPKTTVATPCKIGEAASAKIGLRKTKWRQFGYTHVLRPKSKDIAKKFVVKVGQAVANKNIGYAPKKTKAIRTSFYKQAKAKGWAINKITTKCYTCCSQMIAVCLNAVGIKTPHDVNARNLIKNLSKRSDFTVLKDRKYLTSSKHLIAGDILAAADVHAAAVLEGGTRDHLMRGDKSPEVTKCQLFFNWAGFRKGEVDQTFGEATEKACIAFEKAVGLAPTGKVGVEVLAAMKAYKR